MSVPVSPKFPTILRDLVDKSKRVPDISNIDLSNVGGGGYPIREVNMSDVNIVINSNEYTIVKNNLNPEDSYNYVNIIFNKFESLKENEQYVYINIIDADTELIQLIEQNYLFAQSFIKVVNDFKVFDYNNSNESSFVFKEFKELYYIDSYKGRLYFGLDDNFVYGIYDIYETGMPEEIIEQIGCDLVIGMTFNYNKIEIVDNLKSVLYDIYWSVEIMIPNNYYSEKLEDGSYKLIFPDIHISPIIASIYEDGFYIIHTKPIIEPGDVVDVFGFSITPVVIDNNNNNINTTKEFIFELQNLNDTIEVDLNAISNWANNESPMITDNDETIVISVLNDIAVYTQLIKQ